MNRPDPGSPRGEHLRFLVGIVAVALLSAAFAVAFRTALSAVLGFATHRAMW